MLPPTYTHLFHPYTARGQLSKARKGALLRNQVFWYLDHRILVFFSCLMFVITFKNLYLFIYFNWRTVTSQYFDGFCHTATWISHMHTRVTSLLNPWIGHMHTRVTSFLNRPPAPLSTQTFSQSTSFGFPASYIKLHWLFLHMVMYMFQCDSHKFYLFFWLHWAFIDTCGLSLAAARVLIMMVSPVAEHGLENSVVAAHGL